jgi:hypothetical protein
MQKQQETANIINSLIEQSQNVLLCGPDCQNSKTAAELEQKYLDANLEMKKAPSDFENAKKNYYVFTEGESAYNTMLEEDLKKKADRIGKLINDKFIEEINQAKTLNTYLNTDIINSKNTLELYKNYYVKNKDAEKIIKYSHGDIITNDRKSYYENQEKDNLKGWYNILLISYYILALVYFGRFVLSDNNLSIIKKIFIVIFLIIFPYIIDPITVWVISLIQKIAGFLPKDVYHDL